MPCSLHHLSNALGSGLILIGSEGRIELWNAWMAQYCRTSTPDVLGMPLTEAVAGQIERRILLAIREALDLGLPSRLSHALHPCPFPLYRDREQTERMRQSVSISPLPGSDGGRHCLVQIADVSQASRREELLRRQAAELARQVQKLTEAQEQLQRGEQRFRELARQAAVGIFEADAAGRITFANERWYSMTGMAADLGRLEPWFATVAAEDRMRVAQLWSDAQAACERFAVELRSTHRDSQRTFWMSVETTPVRAPSGILTGWVGTSIDIHDNKEAATRSAHQATYDTLTGLYHRTPFNERLERAIGAARLDQRFALLFVDLDAFKPINDTYGHEVGDLVLKTVARRLRRALRADDVLARFGGDEFVILLAEVRDSYAVEQVVTKLQRAVRQPMNVGVCHLSVGCSIGAAVYPDDGRDASTLLRSSDVRMYAAKRARRGGSDSSIELERLQVDEAHGA